ncbi:fibrobacter succinogenes major paralogous domain-containing protein [Fibrobacter sp. UWH4]|uniref:fibrobacter succinogenes major paralogous domain-containing protein n=1 Tax=Fibrobacter sp. UWH4 TaxID=1896210 RepID=UPI000922CDAB|nr:fibrobacter succinogenes major paralogous domain-containing protein [Fibrobacter sp. UWH4]SHL26731.1 major paralogous domain-containing protein [Fibrobacter sp. UWH4]
MRREKNRNLGMRLVSICALASMAFLAACSSSDDKSVAGGASGDAGVVAVKDLDVAGVSQKGPFVKGSAVTVQGIDCKTMNFTDEVFEGEVKNNMGEFVVEKVNLSTTCAVVAVTGEYRSEMTGKKVSDKLTLRALTNLKDRTHVNVNLLTNLEYERVMYYVAEKGKTFDEAKDLAETEVLAAFGMAGDTTEFEALDIFGTSDADATLLAISVLMQGDADVKTLTERMDKFNESFAESGKWNDDDTKKAIIDWIANAVAKAVMDSIRKNMENWGFANEVPDFETAVDAFATNVSKEKNSDSVKTDGWSWDVPKEARFNPNIKYDSIIDPRDKQVYKVVKIEVKDKNYSQVWMAENLNYADSVKTPSLKGQNWCYNNDEKNCKVSGRYYTWAAAIDSVALANDLKNPLNCGYGKTCGINRGVQGICPDGWHLPTLHEWGLLSVALGNAGVAGDSLKALTGWDYAGTADNNGVDAYGFAALPTGRMVSTSSWSNVGSNVYYWSSEEDGTYEARYSNINNIYTKFYLFQGSKKYGQSVRCIKGDPSTAAIKSSSSSSVDDAKSSSNSVESSSSEASSSSQSSSSETSVSSSSVESSSSSDGFDWSLPKEAYLNPDIEYDSIVDSRDGKVYKTVKIGDQTWMAENLNFDPGQGGSGDAKYDWSWCRNCEVIGYLYTWAAAIDSVKLANDAENPQDCGYGKGCGLTGKLQGICPAGWHLPSKAEWQVLFDAVGGRSTAGEVLKSQTGWYGNGNGTDAFGFSALPAGDKSNNGYFYHAGDIAYFWSATGNSDHFAYLMYLGYGYKYADLYDDNKNYGYSVRCVKD